jgi:hypothetical protein
VFEVEKVKPSRYEGICFDLKTESLDVIHGDVDSEFDFVSWTRKK